MQNHGFLPSVSSSLSTMTTATVLTPVDSEASTPTTRASPAATMFDNELATRFYIGDDSTSRQGSSTDLYASQPVVGELPSAQDYLMIGVEQEVSVQDECHTKKEESDDYSDALTAATALMGDSTKKMAGQNSFDSGYGIIIGNAHPNRFISCDSEAAIVLNADENAADSGVDDDSLASGSFTNGTFGSTKIISVVSQVFFAIMLSSAGNFGAGLILDHTQTWTVYHRVPELFYLVPALLGLKGNLEMTMVARLSTSANMGKLNTIKKTLRAMAINISLVQCQAIVISFLASAITFLASIYEDNGRLATEIPEGNMLINPMANSTIAANETLWVESTKDGTPLDVTADVYTKVCVIFATSLATANAACLGSSIFMILMIVWMTHVKINPDNFATAIAASVGDIVTSFLLGVIGSYIYSETVYLPGDATADLSVRFYQDLKSPLVAIIIISFFVVIFPFLAWVACYDTTAKQVLCGFGAWCPILIAMMVSFVSGAFLRIGTKYFLFMALFQPLINGVGGNLAAITTSRLSTDLHLQNSIHRKSSVSEHGKPRKSVTSTIASTFRSLFKAKDQQNKVMGVFLAIAILVQLFYGMLLPYHSGHFGDASATFFFFYIIAATAQVLILLVLTRFLVNIFWNRDMDPDTYAIPLLTSLGDLLGTAFLLTLLFALQYMGDSAAIGVKSDEDQTLVNAAMATNLANHSIGGVVYQAVTTLLPADPTIASTIAPETTTILGQVISKAINSFASQL